MHFLTHAVPLLAVAPVTLAQHIFFEPPSVRANIDFMMHRFHRWAPYWGPDSKWWRANPDPEMPQQPTLPPSKDQCYYWMEEIQHHGNAAFNPDPTYQVYRNVKDYGALGDGMTDDTAAINLAISSGNRCGPGTCNSSTTTPAVVYFPAGVYMINSSIIDYYYTMLIGNPHPNCMPTLRAFSTWSSTNGSIGIIDGDLYLPTGNLAFGSTNVFWRQIRNFVLDMTLVPANSSMTGIHWPTAQATSIQNVVFEMNSNSDTQHQGVFIESGSGGFMNDLIFNGGMIGGNWGNQQFTMRNLTFNGCQTAINQAWDWGWTYYGININNCSTGLNIYSGSPSGLAVGSITFFDSYIFNTQIGIRTGYTTNSTPPTANSLILENVYLNNVSVAVEGGNNMTILAGTPAGSYIPAWGEGHSYTSPQIPRGPHKFQGYIAPAQRPASLLQADGSFYARSKPQYEDYTLCDFISARLMGARGDGRTDDTHALQCAIDAAAAHNKILFLDHGDYLVSRTLYIPAGSRIVGEAYSVILSYASYFNDIYQPKPVVQVGKPGETGSVELSDFIVSTQGQQMGAILFEYNLDSAGGTPTGVWDVHARIGGFAGSNLQLAECPTTPNITITAANLNYTCIAAFLSVHITSSAAGIYLENNWIWTADHDVEDPDLRQITVFTGRGMLVESETGPVWLVGTAVEHHTKYEYQFVNAANVWAGQTAYYQPNPPAPLPFPFSSPYHDPRFPSESNTLAHLPRANLSIPAADGWGFRAVNSSNLLIYGAGLYSFFDNYSTDCSAQGNDEVCQLANFEAVNSSINLYNLNTVGTHYMLEVDGMRMAPFFRNRDGFIDTIALFRSL